MRDNLPTSDALEDHEIVQASHEDDIRYMFVCVVYLPAFLFSSRDMTDEECHLSPKRKKRQLLHPQLVKKKQSDTSK